MTETQAPAILTCLKCGAAMRTYERSGILIDQCTECRGIFLDRGELDRIIDAETVAARPAAVDQVAPRRFDDAHGRDGDQRSGAREHDDRHGDGDRGEDVDARRRAISQSAGHGASAPSRKRGGLFGDVLDMFGGGE